MTAKHVFTARLRPLSILGVMSVLTCVCALKVSAQDVLAGGSDLLPQKIVGVQDRLRPEYDPIGIRIGTIEIDPSLTVQETYDDNIYATENNKVADGLTTTTGAIDAHSISTNINLDAQATVTNNQYLHNSIENYLDFEGSSAIGYPLGYSTSISAKAEYIRAHLARADPSFPQDAVTPPAYDTDGGMLDFHHSFIHSRLDFNAQLLSFNYHAAQFPNDVFISQDFRNRDELTLDLRDNFLVDQSVSAFLRVIHKEFDYRRNAQYPLDRDAVADSAGGGATFQLTNLLKGEIGVGVLRLRNHDLVDSNVTTISILSNIQFFVTQLITATATVERAAGPAELINSSSFIATNVRAELDYEYRRNVILSASVARNNRFYTGIDESETTWTGIAKARWLVNRSLKLDMSYTLASRRSPIQAFLDENFDDHTVALGVELDL